MPAFRVQMLGFQAAEASAPGAISLSLDWLNAPAAPATVSLTPEQFSRDREALLAALTSSALYWVDKHDLAAACAKGTSDDLVLHVLRAIRTQRLLP